MLFAVNMCFSIGTYFEKKTWVLGTILLLWLLFVQATFYFVQNNQADSLTKSIQGQLRQELDFSNFHFLSRNLSDLQASGTIKCVKLTLSGPNPRSILDLKYKGGCENFDFLLAGAKVQVKLNSLNGDLYSLEFSSVNSAVFLLALWLMRLVGLMLLVGFYAYQRIKEEKNKTLFDLERKHSEQLIAVASQVAHDIRSPLSALNMVMGMLKDLPEEKRILIRGATQRINDIANDLIQKGKDGGVGKPTVSSLVSKKGQAPPPITIEFIPALVDILVSEKRMQFREQEGLAIEADLKDSFGSFININANELKRVISNLVNNAVEAFESKRGLVTVVVRKLVDTKMIEILVKDNGRGIPEHVLARLGQQGVSHGKEGTSSGSGIGVYHAMRTMESFGGKLLVESIVGVGTTMRLILPMAEPPKWFASLVDLTGKTKLVSLDDDISIHQIWSGRLQSLGLSTVEHIKIQSGDVFEKYVYENMSQLKNILFLVDFELINQQKTGLDLIEELGLEKYSVLVTSRYEESGIQERAGRIGLKLLPKSLAGFVPINIETPKEKYDLCLIDDDTQLVHMVWRLEAESRGLNIKLFASPQAFLAVVETIDRQTPIYVDVSLGDGIKGTDFAQEIHKLGFVEINLATGYDADSVDAPSFIRRVVGKDFPELA